MESQRYTVLSLGAGVQSSTMALMAAHGLISPMPNIAVFADTQSEPQHVYTWLDWLEAQLPFPVIRATLGNLAADSLQVRQSKSGKWRLNLGVPVFTQHKGNTIMLSRQCTKHYKVMTVARAIKAHFHLGRSPRNVQVEQWIGISTDEAHRMKPSRLKWIENRFPLIDALMSRADCKEWMQIQGYPNPPKSACVFCPFNSNTRWDAMKRNDPASFQAAVQWERDLNIQRLYTDHLQSPLYIHPSLQPLDTIDFVDHRQMGLWQEDRFGNECEGMCGV